MSTVRFALVPLLVLALASSAQAGFGRKGNQGRPASAPHPASPPVAAHGATPVRPGVAYHPATPVLPVRGSSPSYSYGQSRYYGRSTSLGCLDYDCSRTRWVGYGYYPMA